VRAPRIARKARLRWDKIASRYLLLFPERGLELNDSAAAILKLCDGSHSEEAIAEALARETGNGDLEAVRRDVVAFIDDMKRRGLVDV
jgi:pyrroloquinoline quinone biosynthesis protein D